MFSGIVKSVGHVLELTDQAGDRRIVIDTAGTSLGPLEVGGSIAVNGVCLTALQCHADRFTADISAETSAVTTLGGLDAGARVNLEPPLRLGDPLDGHLVTGHVDGVGRVLGVRPAGGSSTVTIELPEALTRYVARKGSVAVDGVSLTVNAVEGRCFMVNLVPHTRAVTIAEEYRPGTAVNIEVDILARYLERLDQQRA